MKAILVNYNFTPTWLLNSGLDYLLYDRSDSDEYLKDFPKERIIKTANIGNVDYDKLSYLVDNYDTLPDVFLWGKSNLFKFITPEEFSMVQSNKTFTPLLTQSHRIYSDSRGPVNYYERGMYFERNDSWYLTVNPVKYAYSWTEWAQRFFLPSPAYIPFAPGGNYILTRETVYKYNSDLYKAMMDTLNYTQLPGEAHCAERSYYLMWK